MGARQTALNVLIACRRAGAWSNGILKEYLVRDKLDRREAALATRLSYGVLQNRLLLDFYLKQLLAGKVKDLHPVVRDILHLGLYQMYMMDKIPASAAVNESVQLAKQYSRRQRNAPGLVNAVLRNADRSREVIAQPDALDVRYSHPRALVDLLGEYVGQARLEPMLRANNDIPATVVQANTLKTTAQELQIVLEQEGVAAEKHPWLSECLVLSGTGSLEQLESFQKGLYYVQDAAAKLSVLCGEIKPNWQVLDSCAAPGGKSFAAAMAMGSTGKIISCDIHPHKVELIGKGAARLGLSNIQAICQDAADYRPEWQEKMDAVIADVPCSGYGIIRKKPDIRYKSPESMLQLPQLQLQILQNQANYVKPGGLLLYSTCTLVRAENEAVVAAFLEEHKEFTVEALPGIPPFSESSSGMLTLVPGQYDTDGFFICRLRKSL